MKSQTNLEIKLHTGDKLRCKGWRQESLLRLLENTFVNAERPDKLVVYGGMNKIARSWASLQATIRCLMDLEEDETLVVQSGKPVGIYRTGGSAPLVLMATSNLVGRWATQEHFEWLAERDLIMSGGYTAGDWQYIGSQGIVQGTYQTFIEVARRNFRSEDLRGRLIVTAGLGGMGGAQPLAIVMAGGVGICVEVDHDRIIKRLKTGYLQTWTDSLADALTWAKAAAEERRPASIGLLGNAAEILPQMYAEGIVPDVVTDQTIASDPLHGYVPAGYSLADIPRMRVSSPEQVVRDARQSIVRHVQVMLAWRDAGAVAFEYGNNIREQARLGGFEDGMKIPGFIPEYIRPLFARGIGPFRWIAISGDPRDIDTIDSILSEKFPGSLASAWVPLAQKYVQFQGLPARIAWLGHGERARLAAYVNEAVAAGTIAGPVAFTRDHLDCGGVAQPLRETEGMPDQSDAVSDWPLLNGLLTSGAGADLVAIHGGGGGYAGYRQSAGVTVVADGSERSQRRLAAVLSVDTAIGVVRHADAGCEGAMETLNAVGDVRGFAPSKISGMPR